MFALEFSLANVANPLIVERIPFAESISLTQDRQSIAQFEVGSHNAKALCAVDPKKQSGRWMVV